ncbi:MAG: hypothetical protein H7Y20_15060 [Bryobacteraceae bacterium]|nr:hypothetical protein [Bryobacteraceae bacterium]
MAALVYHHCNQSGIYMATTPQPNRQSSDALRPVTAGPVKSGKISPIVWILLGIAALILVAGVLLVAGGIYVAQKIAEHPAATAASILAATNPDIEILSKDENAGQVTFREKSTGKTVTLNLDQMKQGKILFSSEGKDVVMEAGANGIQVKSSDGSRVDIGKGVAARFPGWIPDYPGGSVVVATSDGGDSATVVFTTRDNRDKVLTFYESAFRKSGLNLLNRTSTEGTTTATWNDNSRQAVVTVSGGNETSVSITYNSTENSHK